MCVCVLSRFSYVQLFATLWTIARQASLSMEFSRQECWSGLPFLPAGDLPNPGIELASPASLLHCRQILLLLSHSPKKWRLFLHYYLSFRLLGEPLIQTNIHISLIIISFLKLLYVNKDPSKFYTVCLVNMSL